MISVRGGEIGPRRPRPTVRVDLFGALGAALAAVVVYVLALSGLTLPPRGAAVVLFAVAPVCAVLAWLVLTALLRMEAPEEVGWFTTGLGVGAAAMVLQLISFPSVAPGGGVLATGDRASAALYLLFHAAPAAGAVAGVAGLPWRWRRPSGVAGLVLVAAVAAGLVPLPDLLHPDGSFTGVLIGAELALAGLLAGATVLWLWAAGRSAGALQAWIGVALSLAAYDVLLNAVAGRRFDAVWWSSLSLRVASYAVLIGGVLAAVLGQLRELERYSEAELDRREGQLRRALAHTRLLLEVADDLARALTPARVAEVLLSDAISLTELADGLVLTVDGSADSMRLAGAGRFAATRPDPMSELLSTGTPMFCGTAAEVAAAVPNVESWFGRVGCLLVLPLRPAQTPTVLVLAGRQERSWLPAERELLSGLAAQGGQALVRAELFERERDAAATLQRSLLPAALPSRDDVGLAVHYRPGQRGLAVGGDWYDCLELPDGRLALVVGGVMGKGLRAAGVMGRLRSAVRALALSDPEPAAVLSGLDRLADELTTDEIVTLLFVLLDPVAVGFGWLGRGICRCCWSIRSARPGWSMRACPRRSGLRRRTIGCRPSCPSRPEVSCCCSPTGWSRPDATVSTRGCRR